MSFITDNLEESVDHIVQEIYYEGAYNGAEKINDHAPARLQEIRSLIHAEAINLADKIIGKDIILHNLIDSHGDTFLDPSEKAIFDHQVRQRLELAKYQNPPKVGATGPEEINEALSENEA